MGILSQYGLPLYTIPFFLSRVNFPPERFAPDFLFSVCPRRWQPLLPQRRLRISIKLTISIKISIKISLKCFTLPTLAACCHPFAALCCPFAVFCPSRAAKTHPPAWLSFIGHSPLFLRVRRIQRPPLHKEALRSPCWIPSMFVRACRDLSSSTVLAGSLHAPTGGTDMEIILEGPSGRPVPTRGTEGYAR